MQDSSENSNRYTIAFYNLENLFDTIDDPTILDDDYTEVSEKEWNDKRFRKKITNLGKVISNIGYDDILHPPVIVGVAEVENQAVLNTLVNSKFLKSKRYQTVHFDSLDERGIDTALLYRTDYFKLIHSEVIPVFIADELGVRDFTRDILYVKGNLENETVHILVNHWPSRRAGAEETTYKRMLAASKNKEVVQKITTNDPSAKIIIMGDFNDDPHSESIKSLTQTDFFNPMEVLLTLQEGSLNYQGAWNLFDQILLSHNFLQMHENTFRFDSAKIFNPKNLTQYAGKFRGNPFRTFAGNKYLGGISDHFPVYGTFTVGN